MNTTVFVEDFKKTTKRILLNIPTVNQKNATIELLKSSVLIAISGALRVYIACLLLQTQPSIITCIAGGLIIYSVYTLDRSLDSEEDIINRKELSGSKKEIGIAASIVTFLIGSYVLAKEGMLAVAFLPLIIGFLYSKGVKIGKCTLRLKGGLGIKNVVVGLIWGISIVGIAGHSCKSILSLLVVFILYEVKVFINSTIDDFKDIKGDTMAGINTLPIYYGEQKTRNFLLGLHVLLHIMLSISLIKGVIAFEPIIIVCSFISGAVCILRYTNEVEYLSRKSEITFFKDGEAALIVGLNAIFNSM
jgi:4-hydroxybenzoate polyprenyltransferase